MLNPRHLDMENLFRIEIVYLNSHFTLNCNIFINLAGMLQSMRKDLYHTQEPSAT